MNTIKIVIKDKYDYINKFNNDRISPELNNYILDECKPIGAKEKLNIEIISEFKMDNVEKEKLISMIKASYNDDIIELSIFTKRLVIIDLIMFLVGIIFLFINYISHNIIIMSEVILIMGWVLIWESIYNFLFSRIENRQKTLRRKQLVNSNIKFIENTKQID